MLNSSLLVTKAMRRVHIDKRLQSLTQNIEAKATRQVDAGTT